MNRQLLLRARDDFRARWRESLAFHLLMQLLGLALFTPLVSWVAQRILLATGEPVISNYDIAHFVLSPTGAAFLVVIAALTLTLLFAELAGQSWIAGHAITKRSITVASTIAFVLTRLPIFILLSARSFTRLLLLLLPFLAAIAVLWLTVLRGHDVNYYLAENPAEWRLAKVIVALLAIGYALLAVWQLTRWLYAVPILALEGGIPFHALRASMRMTKGHVASIATPLVLWWLFVTAVMLSITWICRQASDAGLVWAGIEVSRVLPLVALYVTVGIVGGFLYGGAHLGGHQFLVTRMFAEQHDPSTWRVRGDAIEGEVRSRRMAHIAIPATLALFAAALAVGGVAISQLALKAEVGITAHRGASIRAPENTMAAFRAALDAGATYIELDVQHTRDRRIVLLHDGDLLRIGSDARKLGELTESDLAAIDIGRKYDAKFTGERTPTLEEVIALVRGKAKINVELKYNVPDPELAPAVIDLLRREDFIDQVVITSLDYAALRQVESIEPRLVTGHIVTKAVGDILRTDADFLSLGSALATRSLIRRAHAAGKKVHVWTVNNPDVMLRMIERGADNIITDDPALLVKVLHDRNALSKSEMVGFGLRVLFSRAPAELIDPAAVEEL
jgi:glycerophosphoryl diester phosphodiesterase